MAIAPLVVVPRDNLQHVIAHDHGERGVNGGGDVGASEIARHERFVGDGERPPPVKVKAIEVKSDDETDVTRADRRSRRRRAMEKKDEEEDGMPPPMKKTKKTKTKPRWVPDAEGDLPDAEVTSEKQKNTKDLQNSWCHAPPGSRQYSAVIEKRMDELAERWRMVHNA